MPPTNQLRTDSRLTQVSLGYTNDGFIANEVAPIILVEKEAGKILSSDLSNFVADPDGDDVIARGELPGLIKNELSEATYVTRERAKGVPVHDDEVDTMTAEDAPYDVLVDATELATDRLLLNREVRVARLFASIAATAAVGTAWDQEDSDPLADVTAAMGSVRPIIGMAPNSAIVPWNVFSILRNNAALKSFFSGGATSTNLGLLSMDALKAIFNVQNIYVPGAGLVKEGNMPAGPVTAENFPVSDVWGDDVILFYKAPTIGRRVLTTAATFVWKNAFRGAARNKKGLVVTRTYEQRARTLIIDARTYSDEKIIIPGAAYRLSGILTPASS